MTEAMLRGAAGTRLLFPPMEREAGLKERGQSKDRSNKAQVYAKLKEVKLGWEE